MIKKILESGNKILRGPSKNIPKIDKRIRSLINDLKETLEAQVDPEGVGLAAPQIGVNLKVFVTKPAKEIKTYINPKIISSKKKVVNKKKKKLKEKKIMEGCLSLPHYYSPLDRDFEVKLKYTNEAGKKVTEVYTGIEAQIVQHEVDHLSGILFVDRLLEQDKPLYEYKNGEWDEVEL